MKTIEEKASDSSYAGAELCVRVAPQNFEIFLNIYNYFNVFKI